jgi:hypothetical protein
MERDFDKFPDDENGDILWDIHSRGNDLTERREVDFSVIFPTEEAALQFAMHLLKNEQKVSFSSYEGNEEFPWQVQAHPVMKPTHGSITGYENQLGEDAASFGGRNDGWGFMSSE